VRSKPPNREPTQTKALPVHQFSVGIRNQANWEGFTSRIYELVLRKIETLFQSLPFFIDDWVKFLEDTVRNTHKPLKRSGMQPPERGLRSVLFV
jgi:hypothetical protein